MKWMATAVVTLASAMVMASASKPIPNDALPTGVDVRGGGASTRLHRSERGKAVKVWSGGAPITALEVGELDSDNAGPEVAVLLADGSVSLLKPGATPPWSAESLRGPVSDPLDPRLRQTIAIGDVDFRALGNEIVVCHYPRVVVFSRSGPDGAWEAETIVDMSEFTGTLWGARVGDYNTGRQGDEIFVIRENVFDFSDGLSFELHKRGEWRSRLQHRGEVGMDSLSADLDPARKKNERIVTTEMGPTYQILGQGSRGDSVRKPPSLELWDNMEDAGWVLDAGDVDPAHEGIELVVGTRYTTSILVAHPSGRKKGNWVVSKALDASFDDESRRSSLWDVAVGQMIPDGPAEIAGVDDFGRIWGVRAEGAGWQTLVLDRTDGDAPLYAVAVADVTSAAGGEVLAGGEDGELLLLETPWE